MKTVPAIFLFTVSCLLIILSTRLLTHQCPIPAPDSPVEQRTTLEPVIMSIRELQQALNDKGHSRYKCEVDGRMGKETLKAWDNWICDRQAKKEFEASSK